MTVANNTHLSVRVRRLPVLASAIKLRHCAAATVAK